jgi:hypothetical protein
VGIHFGGDILGGDTGSGWVLFCLLLYPSQSLPRKRRLRSKFENNKSDLKKEIHAEYYTLNLQVHTRRLTP